MQFALLVYESPELFATRKNDETDTYLGAWRAYYEALVEAAVYVGGNALEVPGDWNYGTGQGRKAAGAGRPPR